jgi:hypothetical protein
MTKKTPYQRGLSIAIGHHLSEWRDDLTLEQIMDAVLNDDRELITPWQPFEDETGENLYDYIVSMANDIAIEITAGAE